MLSGAMQRRAVWEPVTSSRRRALEERRNFI